ncbi:MAG: FlgD immunoglobulin-like domain containing protein [bacterium]
MRQHCHRFQVALIVVLVGSFFPHSARAQLEYPGPIEILGAEEIIFDWSADSCEQIDIPDAPARAFRDADGKIQLLSTHYTNYRMIGADFNSLVRDCANGPILSSHYDSDPSKYNDSEWIVSTYTTDGKNIFAIIHNEYHGLEHPGQVQCNSGNSLLCWYNALTLATSTDTGRTYTHATAPDHLIAAAPYQYAADQGPFGVFGGTNIVYNQQDGYYYVIIQVEAFGLQQVGVTTMRTQDLSDPTSWRAWDGTGYTVQFVNPYTETGLDPANHIVQPIGNGNIEKMQGSLSWSTYFNKWLVVGGAQKGGVWGFYYSISDDLINWVTRKIIMTGNLLINPKHATGEDVLAYPSVIDHADTTRNFEQIGQEAYLYFTRIHPTSLYDRDLVRIPIRFNKLLVTGWEVTGKGDLEDKNVGDGICKTKAGKCSFRAAIQEANARIPSWADTVLNITFNISGGGPKTIKLNSPLQTLWYPVNIDAYTQPGAVPNTNEFGQSINARLMIEINCNGQPGLTFESSNNTIKGLVINRQMGAAIGLQYGDNNVIQGNFLNTDTTGTLALSSSTDGIQLLQSSNNTIGDTTLAARNLIVGGIRIHGPDASNNKVLGNYIGTDVTGTVALNTWGAGVGMEADAQNNTIGGTSSRARNLISGNHANGVGIHDSGSSGNVVINNYIGVDVTGNHPLGNGLAGVKLREGAEGNFIGQPGYGNIICDNNDAGIWIENSSRNFFFGNFIGTNADGSPDLGNHATGVIVFGIGEEMSIGGANAGEGNTIAYNTLSGVALMGNAGNGVKIWSNSIFKNGGSGIDLGFDGWTGNDDGDGDSGPNGWQNYPVLETAISGSLLVSGSLNSTPNTTFRIEFFESDTCDPSGYGEGKTYLDAIAIATDANGDASFSVQLNHQVESGKYVTVTASAPDNSTSEFSNCVMASPRVGVLAVSPESFSVTLNAGENTVETLEISNIGSADIDWTLSWNAAWLQASLSGNTLAPGAGDNVSITIDASGLSEGSYADTLTVSSTEPNQADILVPVVMTVVVSPDIEIQPDSLSFTVQQGLQSTQPLKIKNTGQATLTFTVGTTFTSPWLSVSPSSGSLAPGDSTEIEVGANTNDLTPGSYSGALIVNSNDPDEGNINPPVTLTVIGAGAQISVSPESLAATLALDVTVTSYLFIENVGTADVTWTIDHQETWLNLSDTSKTTAPGQTDSISVQFNSAGLSTDTFSDTLTISHNDTDTPELNIPVSLTVTNDSPVITLTQENLVSTLDEGQSQTHHFSVGNQGTGELQWSITWQASWLDAAPTSGSTPPGSWQEITVTVDATGLAGGEYGDSLLVNSTDPEHPVKKVYVWLTVKTSSPKINVSQDKLVSTLDEGQSQTHQFNIGNQGTGELNWSITWQASWLDAAPGSGTTPPGGAEDITVTIDATGLSGGEYGDSLLVNSTDPENPVKKVYVWLTVTTYFPKISVSQDNLFSTLAVGDSAMHTVEIGNQGDGELNWSIVDQPSWVQVSPAAGQTMPGESDSVKVMFYAAGLTPGNYADSLLVISDDSSKPEVRILVTLTVQNTTSVHDINATPDDFTLKQNYPNPFNPTTVIQYGLMEAARITLNIFDVSGRRVRTLVQTDKPAGTYEAVWDGKDQQGLQVSSGIYFYTLSGKSQTGKVFRLTQRMLFLK